MNRIDLLLRSLGDTAPAADDAEHDALHAARDALRAAIAAEQSGRASSPEGRLRRLGRRAGRRRGRAALLFAALLLIGVAIPAFGVVGDGWIGRPGGEFAGVRGAADPTLTGPPVVVASGEPQEPWSIVIARSNQGLCLNVDVGDEQFSPEKHRLGQCFYSDIRGDLPPDVRGDPSATCIGPTALVACGSLPKFWVTASGWGPFVPEIRQSIFVGAAAAEVASVELVLANGETLQTEVVERPLGSGVPLNVYWAKVGPEHGLRLLRNANGQLTECTDDLVETVVARNAEGRVLGRRVPAWNGNPTGDPDGPRPPESLEDPCV